MTDLTIAPDRPEVALIPPSARQNRLIRRTIFTLTSEEMARVTMLVDALSNSQLAIARNGTKALLKGDISLIIFKGLEIGLDPMAAFESIDLISGKPTLDPAGMLALCQASGQLEDIQFLVESDTQSHIRMKRCGQSAYERIFTIEDAARMTTTEWVNDSKRTISLTEKATWKAMPQIMLKWRNVSAMCRAYMGDIIQGLYSPEELGATVQADADGHMIVTSRPPLEIAASAAPAKRSPSASMPPDAPTLPGTWATNEALTVLFTKLASEQNGGIAATEAARLIGISADKVNDPDAWNQNYATGREAALAVKAAFEQELAQTKPATPKASSAKPNELTDEMLIDAVTERYAKTIADFEEVIGAPLIEKAITLQDALTKCRAIALEHQWDVLAQTVKYAEWITFQTEIGDIRLYGRDKLKAMVGEVFFQENGIADWERKHQYEFNVPLVIEWKQEKGYKLATHVAMHVIDDWGGDEGLSEADAIFDSLPTT